MRDFLINFFGWKNGSIEIDVFSIWHFLYVFLIVGAIVAGAFLLKGKSQQTKRKTLQTISIVVLVMYIVDFMLQPFVTSSHTLDIDKLPFHICTLMSIVAVFAQFSKKDWFKEIAVCLAMAGSLMYLVYPGSALGGISPFCYKVVQTMIYHGLLLAWGVLSLTTGQVKLHPKKMWMPLVAIVCVALWASIGNLCYNGGDHHYDWFFLTGSTFPFIPSFLMPVAVVVAVYGVVACFYLIYWLATKIASKYTPMPVPQNQLQSENPQTENQNLKDKE